MDDRPNIPDPSLPEGSLPESFDVTDASLRPEPAAPVEISASLATSPDPLAIAFPAPPSDSLGSVQPVGAPKESGDAASRRRSFRNHLFLLLGLALAAFVLTSWILVRVDSPFGMFSSGPQDVVRAQLRALDRGELRPAYDMFSPRYRGQVSFDTWHELFITHWRMFHAAVVQVETPEPSGPGVALEIYLRGADDKDYRARFTLIRAEGRWWIDDVHWTEEASERDVSRT